VRASAVQRQAKLGAVEALLWNGRPGATLAGWWGRRWKVRGFFKRHLGFQIVRLLDVGVQDVSLHLTVDQGLSLGGESPRGTPKASSSKGFSGDCHTCVPQNHHPRPMTHSGTRVVEGLSLRGRSHGGAPRGISSEGFRGCHTCLLQKHRVQVTVDWSSAKRRRGGGCCAPIMPPGGRGSRVDKFFYLRPPPTHTHHAGGTSDQFQSAIFHHIDFDFCKAVFFADQQLTPSGEGGGGRILAPVSQATSIMVSQEKGHPLLQPPPS